MRVLRSISVLAISVTVFGALATSPAVAGTALFRTGGTPTCTIVSTSASTSSTTCTGTLAGNNRVSTLAADTSTSGFAVFQCQNADGTVTPGPNQVRVDGSVSSTPIRTGSHPTFTTDPALLAAPATTQAAGCAAGSAAMDPTLTTTTIRLQIDNGSIASAPCTASDPNGLRGTVSLTC